MAAMVNMSNLLSGKDSRWLQLEVCREFQRNKCSRQDTECKFAHPPANVEVQNGKVTACYDSIKGRCNRDKPPCKYFHPPQHLKDQLLINGRNHLALKNALMQQMGIASGQPVLAGQVPTVAANPYLTGIPANTYSPYFAPGHLVPALLGPDPAAVASQLGPVVPQAVQVTQQKLPRSDRLEAYSGMVPIKRPAAEKYGNPVYPGATTYQQLMQLQQPFVPISSSSKIPPNASYVIYTDENGQLLDTLPVCQDFNRSMCSRLNCRFVHLTEDDKVEVCDQRVAVCRDHANGQCRRKQCKYYHIPIVLPPANVMAALINSNTSGISNNNINNNLNQEQQQQQQNNNNYKQQQQQQQKLAGSTIATTNYNNNLIIIEPQHQHPAQQSQQQIHNFDAETTIAGGYGTLTNKIALTTASSKIYNTAPPPPPPAAAVAYHPVHYTTAGTPYHHPHHQLQHQHHHYHITPPYSPSAASTTSSNSSACPKPTSPILSSTTTLSTNSTATKPTPIAATHYVPTTTFLKASPAMTIAIATQAPLLLGNTNTNSEYGSNCIPIITTPPALTPLTPVTQHPAFMYPATPQTQH
ncbi:splicing regulator muscleblind isoform 14-T29 [Glossina fuscipes fuscipes]